MPSVPVLARGAPSFTFTVSDTVPAFWLLYESTDSGATYTQVDSNPYGTGSSYVPPGPGTWYYGIRSADGVTPEDNESNIIVS